MLVRGPKTPAHIGSLLSGLFPDISPPAGRSADPPGWAGGSAGLRIAARGSTLRSLNDLRVPLAAMLAGWDAGGLRLVKVRGRNDQAPHKGGGLISIAKGDAKHAIARRAARS